MIDAPATKQSSSSDTSTSGHIQWAPVNYFVFPMEWSAIDFPINRIPFWMKINTIWIQQQRRKWKMNRLHFNWTNNNAIITNLSLDQPMMHRWYVVIHKIPACIRHKCQSNWPNGRAHWNVWHYFVDKLCCGMCCVETARDFSYFQLRLFDRQKCMNKSNWNYVFDNEIYLLQNRNFFQIYL